MSSRAWKGKLPSFCVNFLVYVGWILLVFSVVIILLAGGEFRKKGEHQREKALSTPKSSLKAEFTLSLGIRNISKEKKAV
jgi:hypothetical protein